MMRDPLWMEGNDLDDDIDDDEEYEDDDNGEDPDRLHDGYYDLD